ncbi:MAG: Uma2 family endonuclease [Jaaginema sp. PMC 1079.18]|nr:Uma2 family endonuclease [Jaaginema sp. PMC 1080.18]MEC4852120.1 Uma2 family endonuclease [Jaaginema sp. PMC 1079.18]MEC4866533.1 Uma2 family endonuclease [Jaaginema sp. PMC 1078.18]
MVQTQGKVIALAEFLKLPETKPASEYIDGQIIQKPMPQGKHSRLQGELVTAINQVVEVPKVALAFPELRCTFGGYSIVPDVTVFAWEQIPVDEDGDIANIFPIAPLWTIEILSPDQSSTKVTGKILHCLNHGTSMGWLIDPKTRSLLVFPQGQQPQLKENSDEVVPVPDFGVDLGFTVGEIWSWLKL